MSTPPPTDSHDAVSLLAGTFAISLKALADGLHKADGGHQMHVRLRFCTACMALAYHGVMHQRVGASRCAWHGVALEEHCRNCAVPAQREAAWLTVSVCRVPPTLWGLEGQFGTATWLRRDCASPLRGRAAAAELTGTIGRAHTVNNAVTTLLRCVGIDCEVTSLLRNPWKPASLLGSGRPAVVINGGVTTLVSQL